MNLLALTLALAISHAAATVPEPPPPPMAPWGPGYVGGEAVRPCVLADEKNPLKPSYPSPNPFVAKLGSGMLDSMKLGVINPSPNFDLVIDPAGKIIEARLKSSSGSVVVDQELTEFAKGISFRTDSCSVRRVRFYTLTIQIPPSKP